MDARLPIFLFAAAVVLGQPAATAQQQPPPPPPAKQQPSNTQPAKPQEEKRALPAADAQFLKHLNVHNLAEKEIAKLAKTKSTKDQVKSLAFKLLTDHQENQSE